MYSVLQVLISIALLVFLSVLLSCAEEQLKEEPWRKLSIGAAVSTCVVVLGGALWFVWH